MLNSWLVHHPEPLAVTICHTTRCSLIGQQLNLNQPIRIRELRDHWRGQEDKKTELIIISEHGRSCCFYLHILYLIFSFCLCHSISTSPLLPLIHHCHHSVFYSLSFSWSLPSSFMFLLPFLLSLLPCIPLVNLLLFSFHSAVLCFVRFLWKHLSSLSRFTLLCCFILSLSFYISLSLKWISLLCLSN